MTLKIVENKYGYEGIRKLHGDIMRIINTAYAPSWMRNMRESYVKLNRKTRAVELVTPDAHETPDAHDYDVRVPLTSLLDDIFDNEITMEYIAQKLNKLTEGE